MLYRAFLLVGAFLIVGAFASTLSGTATKAQDIGTATSSPATPVPTSSGTPASSENPIQHIVILVKENRSFDNYFGTFPGADGTTYARRSDGQVVKLRHESDHTLLDIGHA
ncbi:MAG TPA: alkaline phosphatase family protein, partial [Chloroflexota bacterium]